MKRRSSLAILTAGLCPGFRPAPASGNNATPMETAAQLIQKQVAAGVLESAVLRVHRGGETFERAFGKAASGEAVFLLASISKTLTAAGVMVLIDRGDLRLEAWVEKLNHRLVSIRTVLFDHLGNTGSEGLFHYRVFPEQEARNRFFYPGAEAFQEEK